MADTPTVEAPPRLSCPENTVLVPAGFSHMGRAYTSGVEEKPVDPELLNQSPPHVVFLGPFCVHAVPVTNEDWAKVTLSFPDDQYELVKACDGPSEEQVQYEACIANGKNKKKSNQCVEPQHKTATTDIYLAAGPLDAIRSPELQEWAQRGKGSCSIVERKVEDFSRSRSPKGFDAPGQPVVNTSWFEADAHCRAVGGRLPTEREREKMARGENSDLPILPDSRIYSLAERRAFIFGTESRRVLLRREAHFSADATKEVGSYPPNPLGLRDLIGLWEWTNDWYADPYLVDGAAVMMNPRGPEKGETKVIRGGGFRTYLSKHLSATYRAHRHPHMLDDETGFRCVFEPGLIVAEKKEKPETKDPQKTPD